MINSTSAVSLIVGVVSDYGVAIFAIISAVIVVGLGMLVFRFGWRMVKQSAANEKRSRSMKAYWQWKKTVTAPDYKDPF